MTDQRMTVGQAAIALSLSYNQVQRRVMIGELTGGLDDRGRWWVDARAVERESKHRRAERLGHATVGSAANAA